jgi:hypothetical protein
MSITRDAPTTAPSLLGVAMLMTATVVHAEPESPSTSIEQQKAACVEAHVAAQEQRQSGKLVEAVQSLDACSTDLCPPLVQRDCVAWAEAWPNEIPSIVISARDAEGNELSEGEVFVNDARIPDALSGRTLPLNPGPHRIRLELRDGARLETSVVLRVDERARVVSMAPPKSKEQPSTFPHAAVWIPITAVATIGTGLFAAFAAVGKGQESDLEMCAPNCVPEDVAEMRRIYVAADVSLGVGAAGVVSLALYFAIGSAVSETPPATAVVVPSERGAELLIVAPF